MSSNPPNSGRPDLSGTAGSTSVNPGITDDASVSRSSAGYGASGRDTWSTAGDYEPAAGTGGAWDDGSSHGGAARGKGEFSAFLDDLMTLVRSRTGMDSGDLQREIESRVNLARDQMTAYAQQYGNQARDSMNRGLDASRDMVHERPLSAVAVAAVGGLIVGLLLGRK